ncbi:hypothetical protein Dimus_030397 [Dionaea muscipula]
MAAKSSVLPTDVDAVVPMDVDLARCVAIARRLRRYPWKLRRYPWQLVATRTGAKCGAGRGTSRGEERRGENIGLSSSTIRKRGSSSSTIRK